MKARKFILVCGHVRPMGIPIDSPYKKKKSSKKKKRERIRTGRFEDHKIIAARKSQLTELPRNERLNYLIQLNTVGKRVSVLQQKRVRSAFEQQVRRTIKLVGLCQCCDMNPVQVRHHIKAICFGGGNQLDNIALLCNPCHCLIHPWMDEMKWKSDKLK